MRSSSEDVFRRYLRVQAVEKEQKFRHQRPAVTISRETGAGANAIAHAVARYLDRDCPGYDECPWAVFDRNLVKKILEDHQLSETMEKFVSEDLPFPLSDALESLLGLHPSSWHLKECAEETIRRLAANGNVILVGRGAAIITSLWPNVLHVRLVAPFNLRVQNYAESHNIIAKEAARVVRDSDEARLRYVQSYFGVSVADTSHYDLVINTGRTGDELAAKIIASAVVEKARPVCVG
jgi:Cytidylate kinase-like family